MSLKHKPCCSQQGDQEFNFSQMVFSSFLQPAPVRGRQDAHSVPGCALIQRTSQQDPQKVQKISRSGDVQGTAHFPLLPPGPSPSSSLENLEATTPIYTFYPMPQPHVATCQAQPHLSPGGWIRRRGKEESGRTSALIRNVWGGKEGWGGDRREREMEID